MIRSINSHRIQIYRNSAIDNHVRFGC
ncbi:hypothetical protein BOS5A_10504 [Bosea sp. EC-HK365B]|nr:hypothetical protein BOS5A_10504 [Bosea sp. EC-HK365B]VXC47113.1 hypothetical protein BOSE127_190195 [Bosea sp. 127]